MPFFMKDAMGAGGAALNMPIIKSIFENPFISAAIATLIGIGLVFLLVTDMDKMELARLSVFMYFTMVVILFLNNRMLLQRLDATGGAVGGSSRLDDRYTSELPGRWKPENVFNKHNESNNDDAESDEVEQNPVFGEREKRTAPAPPAASPLQTAFNDVAAGSLYPVNWLGA